MTPAPFDFFHFIKGATAYELQFMSLWVGVYRPRYWRTSGLGFFRFVKEDSLGIPMTWIDHVTSCAFVFGIALILFVIVDSF